MASKLSSKVAHMDWNKFDFEYKYEVEGLTSPIVLIEAYKEAALNLVLPSDWREQLDKLNRVRAVYGTTALEGNPLSEAEVTQQIEKLEQQKTPTKSTKEQMQIQNAQRAQEWVRNRFVPDGPPLTVEDILHMHKLVTEHSDTRDNVPGKFRTHPVTVGATGM